MNISNNNLANLRVEQSPGILKNMWDFQARNCHIPNASQILNMFGPVLHTLDLSGNDYYPGIFRSFTNMWGLYLNYVLTKFDLIESKYLCELHLEGNQLTELNVSHLHVLEDLKIAHNQMTCDYWANFQSVCCSLPERHSEPEYDEIGPAKRKFDNDKLNFNRRPMSIFDRCENRRIVNHYTKTPRRHYSESEYVEMKPQIFYDRLDFSPMPTSDIQSHYNICQI